MTEQSYPEVGDIWRHKGNGHDYRVLDIIQAELPAATWDGGEWVGAVLYEEVAGPLIRVKYARTMRRWLDRFDFVSRG